MERLEQLRREIDEIDREMTALFCRRMNVVGEIAAYKANRGLPVCDPVREAQMLAGSSNTVEPCYRRYHEAFRRGVIELSKQYQRDVEGGVSLLSEETASDIILQRGAIHRADAWLALRRKVLLVTDDGVPSAYVDAVAARCSEPHIISLPQGEATKSLASLRLLLEQMLSLEMTRQDCVAAVGGGMVGDLAGLAAALYMRGVDFYNIPTTLLAQVDASAGGKTAVNFSGFKNIIGAFYRPKRVLIDPDVLSSLLHRHLSAGLAEALKMAVICDGELFSLFEAEDPLAHLDEIISRSVDIKKRIVAADERELGLRRVLNFGHTIGHAVESSCSGLLHGECVALGMLPMCAEGLRARMIPIYKKLGLPISVRLEPPKLEACLQHDKKRGSSGLFVVEAANVEQYAICPRTIQEILDRVPCIMKGASAP